jgi:hypothetical protein
VQNRSDQIACAAGDDDRQSDREADELAVPHILRDYASRDDLGVFDRKTRLPTTLLVRASTPSGCQSARRPLDTGSMNGPTITRKSSLHLLLRYENHAFLATAVQTTIPKAAIAAAWAGPSPSFSTRRHIFPL